jgi:glutamine phosphoribosylpyrophosphate amidotransferase
MCGISAYSGITDPNARTILTSSLGSAIVSRGFGGAGFVSLDGQGGVFHQRTIDHWRKADEAFIQAAAEHETCMMHSRGPMSKVDTDVHPFPIVRNDQIVMWGAHNGMFDDGWGSARANGRHITVDSMELFELLADGRVADMSKLRGWGVITWVTSDDPNTIKICRLNGSSELVAAHLEEGGVVIASTKDILKFGVSTAQLNIREMIPMTIGRTYLMSNGNITRTDEGVTLKEEYMGWGSYD